MLTTTIRRLKDKAVSLVQAAHTDILPLRVAAVAVTDLMTDMTKVKERRAPPNNIRTAAIVEILKVIQTTLKKGIVILRAKAKEKVLTAAKQIMVITTPKMINKTMTTILAKVDIQIAKLATKEGTTPRVAKETTKKTTERVLIKVGITQIPKEEAKEDTILTVKKVIVKAIMRKIPILKAKPVMLESGAIKTTTVLAGITGKMTMDTMTAWETTKVGMNLVTINTAIIEDMEGTRILAMAKEI